MVIEGDSASSDEELLTLRLTALKSKQEVKELIDITGDGPEEPKMPSIIVPNEEDQLRIMALKSTLLKKKEFFRERKKLKKMENDRPYSPSEEIMPLPIDNDAMILSPLGSPFNEVPELTYQEQDMDISNSPINEKESSDMDTAPSPGEAQAVQETEPPLEENNDEEIALRSMLLTSIHKKKETRTPSPEAAEPSGTEKKSIENLKLALQRLKKKDVKPVTTLAAKSGTKTIAMILAEKKNKKKVNKSSIELAPEAPEQVPMRIEGISPNAEPKTEPLVEAPVELVKPADSFLFRTIANDLVVSQKLKDDKAMPGPPPKKVLHVDVDSSFSTITDTKNIPLLPNSTKAAKSRLITTLIPKPVSRLVIALNDSDTDEESARTRKVPVSKTRIVHPPKSKAPATQPRFNLELDSFLKKVRENTAVTTAATTSTITAKPTDQPKTAQSASVAKSSSSVKHLPLESQLEYEELLKKMKTLEEAKQKRLKARQLKRTKSNSGLEPSEAAAKPQSPPKKPRLVEAPKAIQAPKAFAAPKPETIRKNQKDKIEESLSKIPQLDHEAQQRMIVKAEINFKNHRCVGAWTFTWVIGDDA